MKIALRIILFLVIGLVVLGYFLKNIGNPNGKIYIGFGILVLAFILMPLFIYSRYNGRIGDFVDKRMEKEED
jgi:hypothetical protein